MALVKVRCISTSLPVNLKTFKGDIFTITPLAELIIDESYLYSYQPAQIKVLGWVGPGGALYPYPGKGPPGSGGNSGGNNGGGNNGGGASNYNPEWDGGTDSTGVDSLDEAKEDYPFVTHTMASAIPTSGFWHKNVMLWNSNPTPDTWIGWVVVTEGAAVSGVWAPGSNYTIGTWVSYNGIAYAVADKFNANNTASVVPTKAQSGMRLADGYTYVWKSDTVAQFLAHGPILDGVPGTADA